MEDGQKPVASIQNIHKDTSEGEWMQAIPKHQHKILRILEEHVKCSCGDHPLRLPNDMWAILEISDHHHPPGALPSDLTKMGSAGKCLK